MEEKHIVSFSGGKDSTLMTIKMFENQIKIDEIIYVDTGAEFEYMYQYIDKFEIYIKKHYGYAKGIKRLKAKTDWDYWFYKRKKRGKNIGQIYGFPLSGRCHLNSALKMQPINDYYKNIRGPFIVYIGIAANEFKRYKRLKKNERAPLYEWGIYEDKVNEKLKRIGLYNKLYDTFDRLGCFGCPNIKINELRKMRKQYPKDWKKLLNYGKDAEKLATKRRFSEFKNGYTLTELENRFSREDCYEQLKITI